MLLRITRAWVALAGLAVAASAQTVSVSLDSFQNGQTVSPGSTIEWAITFEVSTGDNQGLALLVADLVQDDANPAFIELPQAAAVPGGMTNFARPAGITNPPASGYRGSPRGSAGHKDLLQIGGAQNTFGLARTGTGVGESANVVTGVGHGGPFLLASGTFAAPSAPGVYTFSLANAVANVIVQRNDPPNFSPVRAAAVELSGGSITFTVGGSSCNPCDTNCDGSINGQDIAGFVAALNGNPNPCSPCNSDANGDGSVNGQDISAFIACLAP